MDLKQEIKLSDLMPKGLGLKRKPRTKAHRRALPKEIVGLKIDAAGLSAAQILNSESKSGQAKQLVKHAHTSLAEGIVSGGEVRDPLELGRALGEFFQANGLSRRGVRLGLGNSRILVRLTEMPQVDDAGKLDNMIRFRANEMLSAPLDDAVIDYRVVGSGVDPAGNPTQQILLVVAYRDSIERYLAAADAARLEVVGIDLEAFALLRAAFSPADAVAEGAPGALAAVSVERERTTLAISVGGLCHFARVLEWGDANIDAAVARGVQVPLPEAAELWRHLPRAREQQPADERPETTAAVRSLVASELQTLVRELQASLRFYLSQANPVPVGLVLFSGSLADIPGIADYLRGQLDIELAVLDPFARLQLGKNVERPEHVSNLSVAIGLGIED